MRLRTMQTMILSSNRQVPTKFLQTGGDGEMAGVAGSAVVP